MADPTIQTFCCHWPNVTDTSVKLMLEFNSGSYNAVCLISSLVGICGALYQSFPRADFTLPHRWYALSASRGRQIVIWMAVADLFAALGVFVRSIIRLSVPHIMAIDDSSTVLTCAISSAWIQYFYTATWLWTLCYAIDMRLVLKEKEGHPRFYHTLAWTLPAILTSVGLSVLYIPNANCHNLNSLSSAIIHILPNYFATYIPICIVMVTNPILYISSSKDVENLITLRFNRFTSKEREVIDAIKIKFCLINFVFYICWLPNLINGVLLWTLWFNLPANTIIALWYIMAVTNPLQALCNCMVYRRWAGTTEKLYIPFRREVGTGVLPESDSSPVAQPWSDSKSDLDERTPLLQRDEFRDVTSSINVSDH